ncbi:hypothetical protein [Paenibacillus harenae]|uniref:hypothetical protein n=1 Tax=Paenibacillus harenae TaxID=306543 RepID=UPI000425D959|nr:hypothetical protein [Paenibacillus harenae]
MNRLGMMILSAALLLLLSGCGGWFNTIPKDTVIIKKITPEHPTDEAAYDGVLSLEAVKTLSLNAVNKYYGSKLTMSEVQFELMAVDKNRLKELLNVPQPQEKTGFDYKIEPENMTGGLFFVTLAPSAGSKSVYELVLNDKDGDVVKISKLGAEPDSAIAGSYDQEKVYDAANRFVEEKVGIPLSELAMNPKMSRWGREVKIFYTSKDGKTLKYGVTLGFGSYEVTGFSKDVMALLSFYSTSSSYPIMP